MVVRRATGIDPDEMTQSEFDDCLSLCGSLIKWERGQEYPEVSHRKIDWEGRLRQAFGDVAPEQEESDELAG